MKRFLILSLVMAGLLACSKSQDTYTVIESRAGTNDVFDDTANIDGTVNIDGYGHSASVNKNAAYVIRHRDVLISARCNVLIEPTATLGVSPCPTRPDVPVGVPLRMIPNHGDLIWESAPGHEVVFVIESEKERP